MVIVGFADEVVVGFEHRDDAERFWGELSGRLAEFSLKLNAEKTRLVQFGRLAAQNRAERGLGKPRTFRFLRFGHICVTTKNGRFKLKRVNNCVSGARWDLCGGRAEPTSEGPSLP